jgi:NADH-ubiquinone oxidoreductase chain 5
MGTVYSGIFTILMNRVGDALLVLAISILCLSSPLFTTFHSFRGSITAVFVLVLGLITKSALFPFSPWLPAAMSAPTPISSLVHSSTLVTAGLYLIVRFRRFLYRSPSVTLLLMVTSIFTTFYAGLNSLVETDLKKLIALSTLRHLGFIGLAVSSGYEGLALFHLFTHALFKSLIFMSLGEVIGAQSHYQDTRFLSSGIRLTPESSSFIYMSILRLFGLPFVRGFYSKDMVLESLHFSGLAGTILVVMVYINLVFTYCYTSRVLTFCINTVQNTPYFNLAPTSSHARHLILLGGLSVIFGSLYLHITMISYPMPVVPLARYLPLILLVRVVSIFLLNVTQPTAGRPLIAGALGRMLFLSELNSKFFSTKRFALVKVLTKTVEHGALSYFSMDIPRMSAISTSRLF